MGRIGIPDRVGDPPQPDRAASTWADVGHSPTRSVGRRVLAVERGARGVALFGEWCGSGQWPGIAKPATVSGPGVVDFQAITVTEPLRPPAGAGVARASL